MTGSTQRLASDTTGSNRPFGASLDRLPAALFVAAHAVFLAAGVWLWVRSASGGAPYANALPLYAISQLGFFAYFAGAITMKLAVLVEQMAVFAMVVLITRAALAG